jgi:hypothetical protein
MNVFGGGGGAADCVAIGDGTACVFNGAVVYGACGVGIGVGA